MAERGHSRTGIFMTELILVILFFAISAACCLQVFAKASIMSRQAEELKLAVGCCENLAEQLRDAGGREQALEIYYPDMEQKPGYKVFYNIEGMACLEDDAVYDAEITSKMQGNLQMEQIVFSTIEGEIIYSLQAVVGGGTT